MIVRRFLAAVALALLPILGRADVTVGDTRAEALHQHGTPKSSAKRGTREYFVYANGGRIEFDNGKVVDVKGPLPVVNPPSASTPPDAAPAPATPYAPAASPAPASAAKSAPPPTPVPVASAPGPAATPAKKNPATPPPESEPADPNAAASAALAKHIEKMDTPWGESPHEEKSHSPLDSIPSFLLGLVLRFGLMIAALKIAFKFWEMDAFWKGILAIAGIDLALHAILELLGPVSGGFTTMPGVENGIPGLLLIYTINRFCFNKRLQNAVTTAATVKIFVGVLYAFAGIALLSAAFG